LICVFWLLLWYLQTLVIVFFILHWFVSSDYSFGIFKLLVIVFSVLHWFVSSGCLIRGHKSMKDREHNGQSLKIPKG
jgi:hypothetical protein